MKKRRNAPPLYLITGIVLGLLCGLALSLWVFPVHYTDTQPSTLSVSQKEIYRSLVGRAYLYEADPQRAFSRLNLLGDADMGGSIVVQAQQMLAQGADPLAARGLALLAAYLTGSGNQVVQITPIQPAATTAPPGETPSPVQTASPTTKPTKAHPTTTPFATFTPRPTATARPTQAAPYELVSQKNVCKANDAGSLLQIYVYDASGTGIAGVEIQIATNDGNFSSFFTGFYPEINPGYANYTMLEQETYQIRVGEGGDLIPNLTPPQCKDKSGKLYWGGLELKFKQK